MCLLSWQTVLIVAVFAVQFAEGQECDPDECLWVKCGVKEESCKENQIYRPNGGMCGCCSACVTQLGLGERCTISIKGHSPPAEECGKGLECDGETNTCVRAYDKQDSSNECE